MNSADNYLRRQFGLQGQTAAVTGGGSGIGRQIALALAAAGARVVVVGRRKAMLDETASLIQKGGGEAASASADLTDLESIPAAAKNIAEPFGAPQILVNAAGVNLRSSSDPAESAAAITLQSWNATMAVNVSAPFFLSRELAAMMREKGGGAIVNIGSMQSVRAGLGDAAYGASKGGIAQLTKMLARAWGGDNIRVNAILPGFFPSDMTKVVFDDSQLAQKLASQTILGRNGDLSDLEGAAVFLASPASSYLTGIAIPVDGGFLAK